MNCSPPGSSVHGVFQARLLEWVAISSSRGSSRPRDQNCVSCISCIGKYLPLAPLGKSSSWDYWTIFKVSNFVSVLTLLISRLGSHAHGQNVNNVTFQRRKFYILNLYWHIVDLQYCISFRHTVKWFSYTYTYIYFFTDSFSIQVITEYGVELSLL